MTWAPGTSWTPSAWEGGANRSQIRLSANIFCAKKKERENSTIFTFHQQMSKMPTYAKLLYASMWGSLCKRERKRKQLFLHFPNRCRKCQLNDAKILYPSMWGRRALNFKIWSDISHENKSKNTFIDLFSTERKITKLNFLWLRQPLMMISKISQKFNFELINNTFWKCLKCYMVLRNLSGQRWMRS